MPRIALVGDKSDAVLAHAAIPRALELAAQACRCAVQAAWIATDSIDGADAAERLRGFDAVWCVPGSPYRSMDGALAAIRFAREGRVPFLGTCGGFQHAMIEYARNVRGLAGAEHAESSPEAALAIVTPLQCALVNVGARVLIAPGSRLHAAYGALEAREEYQCRFGLEPRWRERLEGGGELLFNAFDEAGDVRGAELVSHPFFVATLFQPERAARTGALPPLVRAFVSAARAHAPTPSAVAAHGDREAP
jgi:CTP synthase (UTP-ammonia lyase)